MELLKDIWKIISTAELRNYLLHGFLNTLIISILYKYYIWYIGFIFWFDSGSSNSFSKSFLPR